MYNTNTRISNIFNEKKLQGLISEAGDETHENLSRRSIDGSLCEFLTTINQKFESIATRYVAFEILNLSYFSLLLMKGEEGYFTAHDLDFIVKNDLNNFDNNVMSFFKLVIEESFDEARELLPKLASDFYLLHAYGGEEVEYSLEWFLNDHQYEFSKINVMDKFDRYLSSKELQIKLLDSTATNSVTNKRTKL